MIIETTIVSEYSHSVNDMNVYDHRFKQILGYKLIVQLLTYTFVIAN